MNDIVVFDTETTGLVQPAPVPLGKQPQIIEFAAIKLNSDLEEIDRIDFLIDPQTNIPDIVTKITHIDDGMVKGKGNFANHFSKLQLFFVGVKEFVAHNLMFDHDMLKFEMQRMDVLTQFPWPPVRTCTVEDTHHIKGYRLNLKKLYRHCFDKDFKDAHRAMPDVEALTRCYIHLKKRGDI